MSDELNAPLGQDPPPKRKFVLPVTPPQALAGLLALPLAGFVLWAALVDQPFGGEPIMVVSARSGAPAPKAEAEPAPPAAQATQAGTPAAGNAGRTVTIIDGSSGKRQDVVIAGPAGPVARPQLLEPTRHGAVPRIGADGVRPADAYARPVKAAAGKADAPRVAIIIAGLGISASATADALAKLPPTVTLAFAPQGAELERLVGRASGNGHEILLQVPMEPADYPDNDPGPQTLLTTLTPEQNIDRLHWSMSRFQGYVGIANQMGARFTASEQALAPVLRESAKRGLIYVDDGSSARSVAGQIAGGQAVPFAKADIVLDAVPSAAEIERALGRLEALARERGSAVGVAAALPGVIERVAQWAKGAEARGLVVAPISAVAGKAKSS